jgi:hypothetical protein
MQCTRAKVITLTHELRVRVGEGIAVKQGGRTHVGILKDTIMLATEETELSFAVIACCLPETHATLSPLYSPLPLLRVYPLHFPSLPSIIPLDRIIGATHLPHACFFRSTSALKPCCFDASGQKLLHNQQNEYVVHNTLLVSHAGYYTG